MQLIVKVKVKGTQQNKQQSIGINNGLGKEQRVIGPNTNLIHK
jgi:hypothetical protein